MNHNRLLVRVIVENNDLQQPPSSIRIVKATLSNCCLQAIRLSAYQGRDEPCRRPIPS